MKALGLLADLILGLLVAIFLVKVVEHDRDARIELGRTHLTRIDARTEAALADLDDDVFITYYVTAREEMPSHLRRIERDVTDLLDALSSASDGRLIYQIVDPTTSPDLERYAARRKVAPRRVRHVSRDSYSEKEVWSTLTIASGPHTPAVIEGVGVEHLPRLQSLITEHLVQMRTPRAPVIALAAPEGRFEKLRAYLEQRGTVVPVDLSDDGAGSGATDGGATDGGATDSGATDSGATGNGAAGSGGATARLPDGIDLLVWMEPGDVPPELLVEVDRFLADGRSMIVAGSAVEGRLERASDLDVLHLDRSSFDAEAMWGAFGMQPVEGLVLDQRNLPLELDGVRYPAPFRIACIAPNQDFHTLTAEPNGTFLFMTPTPLGIDAEALAERGWRAEVLATTSDMTWVQNDAGDEIGLGSLDTRFGDALAKQPLIVRLRPVDPWKGEVVAMASASPFRDEIFDMPGVAHRRLADVLLDTLAGNDRLVLADAGIEGAEPLPPMAASSRVAWRVVCVLLIPALLLVIAFVRARRDAATARAAAAGSRAADAARSGDGPRRTGRPARRLTWIEVTAMGLVGVLLVGLTGSRLSGRADLTEEGLNALHPTTAGLAADATGSQAVRAELVFSQPQQLPPPMRRQLGRLEDLLDDVVRAGADLAVTRVVPGDLDDEQRDALSQQGIRPNKVTSHDEEVTIVRTVWSALRLTANGRSEVLSFPDVAAFENLEFRLAFALWRLQTGRRPHVAFASDVPRLSAAEAHQHYQTQGLMAPMGKDVYSQARAVLQGVDFVVTHVSPRDPVLPDDVDLLVWLQPRRSIGAMLSVFVDHLYRGGSAILAAQHFNIQSRQYRGGDFEFVYWPQPQSPDVEVYYFPELGIDLVREVLFDELNTRIELESQVTRETRRDFDSQESALSFVVRAVGANFAEGSLVTHGLGDQAFLFGAFLEWDAPRLAELGITATPLITTSERAWTYLWSGGWIPPELLEEPPVDDAGEPRWQGPLTLAALFEGQFPWPEKVFERQPVTVAPDGTQEPTGELPDYPISEPIDDAAPGRLLYIGGSEMLKDDRLVELAPEFRGDQLLLNAAAALGLPEDLAAVLSRRPVARGFGYVPEPERRQWRLWVPLGVPLLYLLLGLVRWLATRRAPTTVHRAADPGPRPALAGRSS